MVAEVRASLHERNFKRRKNEETSIGCQIDELSGSNEKAEIVTNAESNDMDISIEYNAAAKLAYSSSNKSMNFEFFLKVYVADTSVAMVAERTLTNEKTQGRGITRVPSIMEEEGSSK